MKNTSEVKPAPKLFPLIDKRLQMELHGKRAEEANIQLI